MYEITNGALNGKLSVKTVQHLKIQHTVIGLGKQHKCHIPIHQDKAIDSILHTFCTPLHLLPSQQHICKILIQKVI